MPDFVKVILQHHADTNICDAQHLYPIHAAAKAGHEDVVDILLKNGVDVNLQMRFSGQTALHVAAINSRKEVIVCLVNGGNVTVVYLSSLLLFYKGIVLYYCQDSSLVCNTWSVSSF